MNIGLVAALSFEVVLDLANNETALPALHMALNTEKKGGAFIKSLTFACLENDPNLEVPRFPEFNYNLHFIINLSQPLINISLIH